MIKNFTSMQKLILNQNQATLDAVRIANLRLGIVKDNLKVYPKNAGEARHPQRVPRGSK